MKRLFIYIKNNPGKISVKIFLLFIFIFTFTFSDLIIKQIVYIKLKDKPDVIVIPGFWQYHYQINDDIGFSLLRWIDKYFSVPKKIKKERFESKILGKLDNNFYKEAITGYYRIKNDNNLYYELQADITNYDREVIKDIFHDVNFRTLKWLIIVCLQGLASIVVIIFFFYSFNWRYLIPLCLIISGALGNLIDRIIRSYVVDFVMWTFKFFPFNILNNIFNRLFDPWPIFNLADVYTVIGAVFLFIVIFFFSKNEEIIKKVIDKADVKEKEENN